MAEGRATRTADGNGSPPTASRRRPGADGARPLLGVALIVGMGASFAALDTSVRWLGGALPVLLLLAWRYGTQAVVMAAWLAFDRRRGFRPGQPGFQLLRGTLLLVTSAFSFVGLQYVPVAEFTAINMLAPVLVTLLAAWLLKEAVSVLRWLLVAAAFAGALIVIRPGSGLFGWAVVFPLGCACTYALFQVLTSRLAAVADPLVTHFWTGAVGLALVLPVLLLSGIDVGAALASASRLQWAVLVALGLLGTGGHLLLILAFQVAPASTLMPFVYTQIASATLAGWWVFGRLPDAAGWAGMALIGVSGAASTWLNVRAAGRERRAMAAAARPRRAVS